MERRQAPVQIVFRVKGPLQQPTRQTANRGRYGPPNRPDYRPKGSPVGVPAEFRGVGGGGALKFSTAPVAVRGRASGASGGRSAPFIRNPKYPKSLYDVEMSMRKVYKNKPVKLTPGMSFPDPKSNRSISNPRAPRFEYEFEPTRDDYNIIHNLVAGVEDSSEPGDALLRERYIDAVAYSDSDSDSDTPDGQPVQDDDSRMSGAGFDDESDREEDIPLQQPAQVEEQPYVNARLKAHRVREAQLLEGNPPPFEPQPPPPRAPVDPVLVIPRAMVREEEYQREQRYGSRNGGVVVTPDGSGTE